MTQGAGFIGLAAMIVGRWTPVGAMGAALLFASSRALARAINFTSSTTDVGAFLKSCKKFLGILRGMIEAK